MNEPLTDAEIAGMKKYYENCMEPKPDVFALLATIDKLDGDINIKDLQYVALEKERDELNQLVKEMTDQGRKDKELIGKLQGEIEKLEFTANFAQAVNRELKELGDVKDRF